MLSSGAGWNEHGLATVLFRLFGRTDQASLLAGTISAERYAACRHVVASRRGTFTGPADAALAAMGLCRETMVVVPDFSDALRGARRSNLVALVPSSCLRSEETALTKLSAFELPVATPEIVVSALWHPRMDADPTHRWLRETVMTVCREVMPGAT